MLQVSLVLQDSQDHLGLQEKEVLLVNLDCKGLLDNQESWDHQEKLVQLVNQVKQVLLVLLDLEVCPDHLAK